jgi:hypothetical protein
LVPSAEQLDLMDLGPGFDEPPLPLREVARHQLDGSIAKIPTSSW